MLQITDDIILKFQAGCPILIEDICAFYPATLREIVEIGYSNFEQYLGIVSNIEKPVLGKDTAKELRQLLQQLTDFQYMLMLTSIDAEYNKKMKEALHFFTHEQVFFSLDPPQIVMGPLEEKRLLGEGQFYDLQALVKRAYFLEQEGEPIIIYDNDPPSVKRLKMQMRVNREKVKRAKAKQNRQKKSELQFSDLVGSLAIGVPGLNMNNIWDLTYYSMQDQLKRMGFKDTFDMNSRAALAGAKISKKDLKHWIKSINEK